MGEEANKASRSEARFQWWRDTPVWLQAIAAILGLLGVGGVVDVVHSATAAHRSHPNSPPARPGSVRWQGAIAINSNGIELDDVPPTTGGSTYTFSNSGGSLVSGNGSYAGWAGPAPSYDQCRTFALTHGSTSSLQLTSGLDLCVRTGAGRTAYVKITSLNANGTTAEAQVTIWGEPSDLSPRPGASKVRWTGTIAINSNGIELDDIPPTTGGSTYTLASSSGSLVAGNGSYAAWSGPAPGFGQCQTYALTHGSTSSLQLTSGLNLCVRTGAGRTAYVKITSLSSDGSTANADVIVWGQ
jgi:hypothetical protein